RDFRLLCEYLLHLNTFPTRRSSDLRHFSQYGVFEYEKTFDDVPANHWASRAVAVLSSKHVLDGVSDTSYLPNRDVTRAEFVKLLDRKSTRLNSSHVKISYAVFCLQK